MSLFDKLGGGLGSALGLAVRGVGAVGGPGAALGILGAGAGAIGIGGGKKKRGPVQTNPASPWQPTARGPNTGIVPPYFAPSGPRQAGGHVQPRYDDGGGVDAVGRPLVTGIGMKQVSACPPGYVAVDMNGDGIPDACALRSVAISAGLWRPKRKPPISAGDWRKLQVAERVKKKAKTIASKAGYSCATRGARRRGK